MNATKVAEITPEVLASWVEEGRALIVDVREPAESASECIPGAVSVPLSRFDAAAVPVEEGKVTVLYCRSGRRSSQAAEELARAGHPEPHHLGGGIEAWKQKGGAVRTSDRKTVSLERQVRIAAGALTVIGTVLGLAVSPWLFAIPAFVGAGLLFAGITDTCGMAMLLARLPYNQRA
ncbi:MAG: rhodanese-like domain-containing protein [Thermoanaerobaculia bacterium]|nr:rhodanese-like domain-containing protein [Thermoanaerobaculia bacterium]